LTAGAIVFSPTDGATVSSFVTANVPEIEAPFKRQMSVGEVVDHLYPLLIIEHDTTDLDALAPWSLWVKFGRRECGVEAEGARRVFTAIAMFTGRLRKCPGRVPLFDQKRFVSIHSWVRKPSMVFGGKGEVVFTDAIGVMNLEND
jgi:hypothetical protein